MNEPFDQTPRQCIEYHGMQFNLRKQHVRLMQKAVNRLLEAREHVRAGEAEWKLWLSALGVTITAISILWDPRHLDVLAYYALLKWARKTARKNPALDQSLPIWPSTQKAWLKILSALVRNEPRCYAPVPASSLQAWLYTDASMLGFGGVLFVDGAVHFFGASWPEGFDTSNINELEMRAILDSLSVFAELLRDRAVHLRVDNTTALAVVTRARSRSWTLAMLVSRFNDLLLVNQITISSCEWIASELNYADDPSRGTTLRQLTSV